MFKNNLVIIEGVDNSGKSTLAQEFIKNGYEYYHFSAPGIGEDTYRTYMEFLNNLDVNKKYVLDRFHLGEMVYGQIYRNKPGLSEEQFRNINLKIYKFNHLLILAEKDDEIIEKNFDINKEDYTKKEDIGWIKYFFNIEANKSQLNLTYYDYDVGLKDTKLVKSYNDFIHLESCGRMDARYMFIGDTANLKGEYSDINQAFDFGPSSKYLFSLINFLEIELCETYITNAFKQTGDNRLTLDKEIQLIKPEYIIVMGEKAKMITENIYAPFAKRIYIPHPSYLSRFPTSMTKFDINQLKDDLSK